MTVERILSIHAENSGDIKEHPLYKLTRKGCKTQLQVYNTMLANKRGETGASTGHKGSIKFGKRDYAACKSLIEKGLAVERHRNYSSGTTACRLSYGESSIHIAIVDMQHIPLLDHELLIMEHLKNKGDTFTTPADNGEQYKTGGNNAIMYHNAARILERRNHLPVELKFTPIDELMIRIEVIK